MLCPLCILICPLKTKISRMKKKKRSRQLPSLYMIALEPATTHYLEESR